MHKKRIIAAIPVYQQIAVQSIGFSTYLPIGKPDISIEFLNDWGVDEIVVTSIDTRRNQKEVSSDFIKKLASKCFVPLTYGGGIASLKDVHQVIHFGADKVSLNHPVIYQSDLITQIAKKYGNQCVVASVDICKIDNRWKVYDYLNKKFLDLDISVFLKKTVDAGAGELFINAVHKDGMYTGYDIELMDYVCRQVSVPVIACGGAKNPEHIQQLFLNTDVSGAVVGNFFHFYEHSVTLTKKYLNEIRNDIRIETSFSYKDSLLNDDFRLAKKSDLELQHLLYKKIEKEVI